VKIQAPRGTLDVLPADQPARLTVLDAARATADAYGYGLVVTPTFEDTELFTRTSGQGSDVVQKEMYTFEDRSDRSLTLRPEGTAPVARAYLEHGLHKEPQPVKTYYVGPMFRYAAPQKGRYREFWQIGFEAMGSDDPAVDAELIQLFTEIERRAGIGHTRLELNSIGDRACRPAYVERLRAFLADRRGELDQETLRRAEVSPLRVFDTKNEAVRAVLANAPTIGDSLCASCREHFAQVRGFLDAYGVEYELVPTLVRGLDYYTRTVFEWTASALGSQDAVCSGGRYDGLVEQLGGEPTPAIGWALGIERIVALMQVAGVTAAEAAPAVYLVLSGERAELAGLALAERLRDSLPGRGVLANMEGGSFKAQMKRADKSGAAYAVIVGDDEAARGVAAVKSLRADVAQQECPWDELPSRLVALLPPGEGSGSNDGR
jgi:histidyl-tRNA synthetase